MENATIPSHQELEERVKELTAELADNHEVIRKLRDNPIYLETNGWKRLEEVTNKIYKERELWSFLTVLLTLLS